MPDTPDPPTAVTALPDGPPLEDIETLRQRFGEMQAKLALSDEIIASLERRQKIDAQLAEADVSDLEVARLLTEAAVTAMDEPDIALAVTDLRRHKPYLFRDRRAVPPAVGAASGGVSGGVMSERYSPASDEAEAAAAARAATTGDRRDLLHYLRLRRKEVDPAA